MNVLVVRLDNDGDVLLAGPAVRAVAARADRATLLHGPRGRAAARLLPGVDDLVEFRAPWIDPEPEPVDRGAIETLVRRLSGHDAALVLTSFHQSALPTALLLRLAGVLAIAAISDDYPGSLLDVRHHVAGSMHEVERNLSLAETLGFELPADDGGRLEIVRSGPPSPVEPPYVVVHPGASAAARVPSPRWSAELVRALGRAGRRVVITGSPAERELTAHVAGESAVDLGGRTDLAELAEVLAGAEVLVAGNTGPAHLAAAVGTPVASLFAPVVPAARWRPWRVPHVLLGDQAARCRATRASVCPVEGHPCLDGIRHGSVLEAVDALTVKAVPA